MKFELYKAGKKVATTDKVGTLGINVGGKGVVFTGVVFRGVVHVAFAGLTFHGQAWSQISGGKVKGVNAADMEVGKHYGYNPEDKNDTIKWSRFDEEHYMVRVQ